MEEQIVNDPMPEEDKIEKTVLWQRIDLTRSIIERFRGEMTAELKSSQDRAADLVIQALAGQDTATKRVQAELVDQMKDFRQSVSNEISASVQATDDRINKHVAMIERKFNELAKQLEDIVTAKAAEKFAEISGKVEAIRQELGVARADFNEALSNFQVNTQARVSEVNGKLEEVLGKFRAFTKGL